jgi:tRNA(Arg) A34 adenosine deaminase TadA
MQQAIILAEENINQGGGPFGAVVVKAGQVVGTGTNQVTTTNDPTSHAEIVAIRAACTKLNLFSLEDCTLYSSCEPCPMCLSAIYWARISKLFFGATHQDAGKAGFRDDYLYKELSLPMDKRTLPMIPLMRQEAQSPFSIWQDSEFKTPY